MQEGRLADKAHVTHGKYKRVKVKPLVGLPWQRVAVIVIRSSKQSMQVSMALVELSAKRSRDEISIMLCTCDEPELDCLGAVEDVRDCVCRKLRSISKASESPQLERPECELEWMLHGEWAACRKEQPEQRTVVGA